MIASRERAREIDFTASFSDPRIQLVVLIANQLFVVHAHPVKNLPSESPEWNSVHKSFLTTRAKLGITHAKGTAQNGSDKLGAETFVRRDSHARSAYIVSAGLVQALHAICRVIARVDVVAIGPDDHVSTRGPDAYIHCCGDDARRVLQATNLRVLAANLFDDFPRSIGGPPIHHDDFAFAGRVALLDK